MSSPVTYSPSEVTGESERDLALVVTMISYGHPRDMDRIAEAVLQDLRLKFGKSVRVFGDEGEVHLHDWFTGAELL